MSLESKHTLHTEPCTELTSNHNYYLQKPPKTNYHSNQLSLAVPSLCRNPKHILPGRRRRSEHSGSPGPGWYPRSLTRQGRSRDDQTGPRTAAFEAHRSRASRLPRSWPPSGPEGPTAASGAPQVPADDRHGEPAEGSHAASIWIWIVHVLDVLERSFVPFLHRVAAVRLLHAAAAAPAAGIFLASGGGVPSSDPRRRFLNSANWVTPVRTFANCGRRSGTPAARQDFNDFKDTEASSAPSGGSASGSLLRSRSFGIKARRRRRELPFYRANETPGSIPRPRCVQCWAPGKDSTLVA